MLAPCSRCGRPAGQRLDGPGDRAGCLACGASWREPPDLEALSRELDARRWEGDEHAVPDRTAGEARLAAVARLTAWLASGEGLAFVRGFDKLARGVSEDAADQGEELVGAAESVARTYAIDKNEDGDAGLDGSDAAALEALARLCDLVSAFVRGLDYVHADEPAAPDPKALARVRRLLVAARTSSTTLEDARAWLEEALVELDRAAPTAPASTRTNAR